MTIKVIATDMDGTFLTDSKTYDRRLFDQLFSKFQEEDIKFVAASGNQYRQIIKQFPQCRDKMTFVAENGGITALVVILTKLDTWSWGIVSLPILLCDRYRCIMLIR